MPRKGRVPEGDIDIDQRSAATASVVRFVRACLDLLSVVQVTLLAFSECVRGGRGLGHVYTYSRTLRGWCRNAASMELLCIDLILLCI